MASRDVADAINRRGFYVRPSDGQPLQAKQVAARVRQPRYADRFHIDPSHHISLASQAAKAEADRTTPPRGPHGWLNWYAASLGQPRREVAHPDSVVIHPVWEEFLLYSDADVRGGWLQLGPYDVIALDPPETPSIGIARRALLVRVWDHLSDEPSHEANTPKTDVESYFGGDIGDEMAALLGLALARRVRSGGRVRQGLPPPGEEKERPRTLSLGLASETLHRTQILERPIREPMIPWLGDQISLDRAIPLMSSYPKLGGQDAVALVRAARQYVDGLWLADSDPRLAWIKLISALEVVANRFDDTREPSPLSQLRRHRPKVYKALRGLPKQDADVVAEEIARLFNVERKLRSFVTRFDPGPPPLRPPDGPARFDWTKLDAAIAKLYEHRSRDLHDGIAFPAAMCAPPDEHIGEMPSERFYFLAISTRGGQWKAEDLPMHLHVFAHIAGGAIRNWWASLSSSPSETDRS
jgi:hypothetical protein